MTDATPLPSSENYHRRTFVKTWETWVRGTAAQMIDPAISGADLETSVSEMTIAYAVINVLRGNTGMAPVVVAPKGD